MKTLINYIKHLFSVLPTIGFWRRYVQKLLSFTISLKIYMLVTTTYLLLIDKINGSVWSTVFLGIALGRVVEKKIVSDESQHNNTKMQNNVYFTKKENDNEME